MHEVIAENSNNNDNHNDNKQLVAVTFSILYKRWKMNCKGVVFWI
jgi:hypothetical protein